MTGGGPIRVIIADDHPILRQGIRKILELEDGIEVIDEVSDGESAVRRTRELVPDLVLMDINMPEKNGVEAAREIKSTHPQVRILILTIHDDDEYVREAVNAQVEGYLLKDVATSELVRAIRFAHASRPYLHPDVGGRLARGAVSAAASALTPREREVLQLLALGNTNSEIAAQLVISEKTVKNHVSHIFEKLNVVDRLQAVIAGVRLGLVTIRR